MSFFLNKEDDTAARPNVSFSFSKQSSRKLIPTSNNQLRDPEETSDVEIILGLEKKRIKSSIPKEKKKEIIIPMINKNNWRLSDAKLPYRSGPDPPKYGTDKLGDLAVKELLQETALEKEKWEKRDFGNSSLSIPMVMQNKIPEGFETDRKLDTCLRAEESTIKDYDQIPIDQFGVAMLKGMGCNPGDPVGNKNKKYVMPLTVVQRSKGLGLGADKRLTKISDTASTKDTLKLKAGAFVHILEGSKKGSFGLVEGVDESRVIIKLENMKKNISLPFLYVEVVDEQKMKKDSKVINNITYERYVNEHESKNSQRCQTNLKKHHSGSSNDDDVLRNSKENSFVKNASHKKRKHSIERQSTKNEHKKEKSMNWVCPDLRVRFINKSYKNGRYFNQKMTVEDVVSSDCCICRTDDGKCLEDISPRTLETVIPRNLKSYVLIVDGKYKKQLATILERDKSKCIATVQFLSDRQKVKKLSYDSICEYVGDVSQFD